MRARSLAVALLTAVTTLVGGTSASAEQPPTATPLIVGGGNADQVYSFAVSLQKDGKHFCGGSLISPTVVVTAAHCLLNKTADTVAVRIGSKDYTQGGEVRQAAELRSHPKFGTNPSGTGADIAIVRLTEASTLTPVTIAESAPVGTASRILGWGQTCSIGGCGGAARTLQQLDTTVVEPSGCNNIDSAVELCTSGNKSGSGACFGDSGGPQIVRAADQWLLIGATSRAGGNVPICGTSPAVYTSVPAYASWLSEAA